MSLELYEKAILDCERRIGSYIVSGGDSKDDYVIEQIKKIKIFTKIIIENETR